MGTATSRRGMASKAPTGKKDTISQISENLLAAVARPLVAQGHCRTRYRRWKNSRHRMTSMSEQISNCMMFVDAPTIVRLSYIFKDFVLDVRNLKF